MTLHGTMTILAVLSLKVQCIDKAYQQHSITLLSNGTTVERSPELVRQSRASGEVGQVLGDGLSQQTEQGLATEGRDTNVGGDGPAAHITSDRFTTSAVPF